MMRRPKNKSVIIWLRTSEKNRVAFSLCQLVTWRDGALKAAGLNTRGFFFLFKKDGVGRRSFRSWRCPDLAMRAPLS